MTGLSKRTTLVLVASLFMFGCAVTTASSPTGGNAQSTSTATRELTIDAFGNPATSSSAELKDCPLAFAGWTQATANQIDVVVRLPGPVAVDITVKRPGRVDDVQNGVIADLESSRNFRFDVASDEVEQVLLHITSDVAAGVSCYVTSGD